MDLFRRTVWLRLLTVLLVGLGSTVVAAQPHGPSADLGAGAGDGTATAHGLSPVVVANAIGLLVDGDEPSAPDGCSDAVPSSSVLPGRASRAALRAWAHAIPIAERPLRHRFCVYRL